MRCTADTHPTTPTADTCTVGKLQQVFAVLVPPCEVREVRTGVLGFASCG